MGKKLTTEEFISRARARHGNKYDYSQVVYFRNSAKVRIICPVHGVFEQTPADHMAGKGCRKCAIAINVRKRSLSHDEFIRIAKEVHGDKYDYSKVKYINIDTKVTIGCPIHGYFEQVPYSHIRKGHGCEKCGYTKTGQKLRKDQDEFIREAREIHGDKYDYSKVAYKGANTEVTIICPIHGQFKQTPTVHVKMKCGCYECGRLKSSNSRRIGLERFISDSKKSHIEVYDYSKSEYVNSTTEIEIICPKHGPFFQLPMLHRYGARCPKCCGRGRSTEDYILQARLIHGDKYDYSKTIYRSAKDKVLIVCPEHGEFLQTAIDHLSGRGCPYCAGNTPITEAEFLARAKAKYGEKFDYTSIKYIDYYTPIRIICPVHGEFMLSPHSHLNYALGCVSCSRDKMSESMSMSTSTFIERAKSVHGERYDYSLLDYKNSNTKVKIRCKKHNYIFEQNPSSHLAGCGCPKCNASKMELRIWRMLEHEGIPFESQKRFKWLRHIKPMSLDFFIPTLNIAIECQGLQHFGVTKRGKRDFPDLEDIKIRDKYKYDQCKEHDIRILYFCCERTEDLPESYLDTIYRTAKELLTELLSIKAQLDQSNY